MTGSRTPPTWCPGPGYAPGPASPAPRTPAARRAQGDSWLRKNLGQAAAGAPVPATFLGERYGRIARRRGKAKAKVAVARSILGQVGRAHCC